MTKNQEKQVMSLLNKCVNGIQDLRKGQINLEADVSVLKTDVAELKIDVAELKIDVAELKTDVAELKTDVAELKTDVAELKTDVTELTNGQQRIEKEMHLNNRVFNTIAGQQVRMDERLNVMENASV